MKKVTNMKYATKTEIYQKIKKPLLERKRRARMNNSLDGLKQLMVDLKGNRKILHMDKADMLETTIVYLRQHAIQQRIKNQQISMDTFRYGYMNAVNEVSRILASTPGMTVETGKTIMTHLGRSYNRLQQQYEKMAVQQTNKMLQQHMQSLYINCPLSPTSSGYHSDDNDTPTPSPIIVSHRIWRPW